MSLLGCCPSTSPTCCLPGRRIEELRRSLLDRGAQLRLRTGDAALAGAPGVAAVRHRACAGSQDLQAGRPAQRPHPGPAGRYHAAGGAHRRPPAQPRGCDPPVLLRAGVAHPPAAQSPRASRCNWAPRSMAMPAWKPTSKRRTGARRPAACRLSGAGVDLADAAWCAACWPGWGSDGAGALHEVVRRWPTKDVAALRRAGGRALPGRRAEALLAAAHLYGGAEVWRARRALPPRPGDHQALADLAWLAEHLQTPTRCAGRLRPGRHEWLRLLQRPASRCTAPVQPTRWCAAAATTRSGRSSAATARRWAFSLDLKIVGRAGQRLDSRRTGHPRALGRGSRACAQAVRACASRARRGLHAARP
jgi:hypothetical protein